MRQYALRPQGRAPEGAAAGAAADAAAGEPPPKAVLSPRDDSLAGPPAKARRDTQSGTSDYWSDHKGYGDAQFDGYPDRALPHAKDCVGRKPTSGGAVTAHAHRCRRDGELRAPKLCRAAETMEQRLERVRNTLMGSS